MSAKTGRPLRLPPVAEATRAASLTLALAAAAMGAGYAAFSGARSWLAAEGGLAQAATAALLALTAVAGWWLIRRTPGAAGHSWLLPAAALLGCLEQARYGIGLIGWQPPLVGGVQLDGISALLAALRQVAASELGLTDLDLGAGLATVAAGSAILLARERRAARAASWLRDRPAVGHVVAALGLLVPAAVMELFARGEALRFAAQQVEFGAAAVLARGSLFIPQGSSLARGWRARMRPWLDEESPLRAMHAAGQGRSGRP